LVYDLPGLLMSGLSADGEVPESGAGAKVPPSVEAALPDGRSWGDGYTPREINWKLRPSVKTDAPDASARKPFWSHRWPSMATLKQAQYSRGQKMTPKQATKAYQRGDLRNGTLVNQPYGFLLGELHDGQVLSVNCNAAGAVRGVVVQWPDDATPVYAPIEDLTLAHEVVEPTLLNRVQSFFARHAA
jgi:hypothetical protein